MLTGSKFAFLVAAALALRADDCTNVNLIDRSARLLDRGKASMTIHQYSGPVIGPWVLRRGREAGVTAKVYLRGARPRIVEVFDASESGDWTLSATYYFRADGGIAKRMSDLRTFYGNAKVVRVEYRDCRDKLLGQSVRHLDLTTGKAKEPEAEFIDEPVPEFRHVRELPLRRNR